MPLAPTGSSWSNWRWINSLPETHPVRRAMAITGRVRVPPPPPEPPGLEWGIAWTASHRLIGLGHSPELKRFVLAGTAPNPLYWSDDGERWISVPNPNGNWWYGIAYGNKRFVAVGRIGSGQNVNERAITSPDGKTWTIRNPPPPSGFDNLQAIAFGNGLFVAVGSNEGYTTPDGETWTPVTVPTRIWAGLCWSPDLKLFVAIASDTSGVLSRAMSSSDGKTWIPGVDAATGNAFSAPYSRVCWSARAGRFVAVGTGATGMGRRAASSPDGHAWTTHPTPEGTGVGYNAVAEAGGRLVAVGSNGRVMTSSDGIAWERIAEEPLISGNWNEVVYAPERNKCLVISDSGTVASSPPPTGGAP